MNWGVAPGPHPHLFASATLPVCGVALGYSSASTQALAWEAQLLLAP